MSAATFVQALVEFAPGCIDDYNDADHHVFDPDTYAIILAAIRDCRADLAALAKQVEGELLVASGEKRFVVEGLGEFEIRKNIKRTGWQHDDLLTVLLARIADEPGVWCDIETGEKNPPVEIGRRITQRLRECVSFGNGKVTGLRAIGLQPDEFCKEEPDGYSVKLPPRAADVDVTA